MQILSILLALIMGTASFVYAQSEQVNTTAAQTLMNKTLTAPTITGPTITGTVSGSSTWTTPTLTSPTFNGAISGSASWDSPGSIGTGTAAVGRFSTLTATTALVVGTPTLTSGTGTPEGAVTAVVGSQRLRTDGGTGTTLYIKETGVGNTGWVAVSAGGATTWATPGTIGSTTRNTGAFTTLSVTGQFSSTLATGTAPLSVLSTTKVPNLNSDLLDGGDWGAPIAIGTTTPAPGTFTTLTATTAIVQGPCKYVSGAGSPEGVVTAPVCSEYHRTDGASGTTAYSKEAGTGNVGWAALAPSTIDWTAPGTIGSTTPNSGTFTALAATRLRLADFTATFGATVAIDAAVGAMHIIPAATNINFLIVNPTNLTLGDILMIEVQNTSAATLGTITWDTLYKMATFTKPTTGKNRVVTFRYNGTVLKEINCSPEVPN